MYGRGVVKFLSLFTGIGGFDLGLERAGLQCVGQVEIDPALHTVLEAHWPNVIRRFDVCDIDGTEFPTFDLLPAGYPCQPFSDSGNRKGSNDKRHLWPEVHRIIRNIRPAFVLLENVPGHLRLGFGDVLGDLAKSGYDAEWDCIPAAAIGAPHRRDRVFIVAYPYGKSKSVLHRSSSEKRGNTITPARPMDTLDSYCRTLGQQQWGTEPGVARVVDGVPRQVDRRIIALGNAVVPQVAEWIGTRILREENDA